MNLASLTQNLYKETVIQMITLLHTIILFFRTKISQFLQDLALIVQQILGAVRSVVWATKVSPDY